MSSYTTRRSTGPTLRSISPSTRFNHHYSPSPPSFRSSSSNLNRSISVTSRSDKHSTASPPRKRTCMCSPTNHPGSFRCSLHKTGPGSTGSKTVSCGNSSRLNMRRSAMKNSLVRIGTVEGEWVKRALAALIRPSSHKQRRRGEFRPRPSRLSVTSMA